MQKIAAVLGKELVQPQQTHGKEKIYPLQGDIKRRCKNCEKGITKEEKSKLTKSKEQCESCGTSTCRDHSMRICNDCLEKL